MTQPTFDFSTLIDTYREAMAPLYRAQQEGLNGHGWHLHSLANRESISQRCFAWATRNVEEIVWTPTCSRK